MGAAKPKGSYKEQIEESIPCLALGWFKFLISKANSFVSTNHLTPSALYTGNSSESRFRSGVDLSLGGTVDRTLLLFDVNLVRRKPSRLSISARSDTAVLDYFSSLKDCKASSS